LEHPSSFAFGSSSESRSEKKTKSNDEPSGSAEIQTLRFP